MIEILPCGQIISSLRSLYSWNRQRKPCACHGFLCKKGRHRDYSWYPIVPCIPEGRYGIGRHL